MALYFSCSATSSSSSLSTSFCSLAKVISSEGHLQLLSDGFVFLLLCHQFILQSVNLLLQLSHGLVSELSPGLSLLQLGGQSLDLLLVSLLSGVGLLLGNLQGLEVVGDDSQLLLQLEDLGLTSIGSLLSLLQVRLAVGKLLGDILVGGVSSLSLVPGLLQLEDLGLTSIGSLLSLLLEHLLGTLGVVSSGAS